jgi:hypothetical protein
LLAGVAAGGGHVPDWRDAAAYAPLLDADRSFFAWEWLRRNRTYRAAAKRAGDAGGSREPASHCERPEFWGLHAFEPPGLTVPDARPMWRADVHGHVLRVEAGTGDGADVFNLERLAAISRLVTTGQGREHLLISDGFRAIRIDVMSGTLAAGPAELRYRIAGLASAERPVLTLRRLLALWSTGQFSGSLHPREARARRWILMLRAFDALSRGADQREIASQLLSSEAGEPRWRSRSPSLRSQAQRLARGARHMASGGYVELLR